MVWWSAISPHSKKVLVQIPARFLLCEVWVFSPDTLVSSHSPKTIENPHTSSVLLLKTSQKYFLHERRTPAIDGITSHHSYMTSAGQRWLSGGCSSDWSDALSPSCCLTRGRRSQCRSYRTGRSLYENKNTKQSINLFKQNYWAITITTWSYF